MSNVTGLIARGINESPMDFYNRQDPVAIKTMEIARLCGEFSTQAKIAAITGLILVIFAFFYFGRYRLYFLERLGSLITGVDKVLLICIALCFAVIITRLYFGG